MPRDRESVQFGSHPYSVDVHDDWLFLAVTDIERRIGRNMRVLALAGIVTSLSLATMSAVGQVSVPERTPTAETTLIEQSNEVKACIDRVVPPPWRVVMAQMQTTGPVAHLEASSADLGIPYRPGNFRGQAFVDVGIGRFHGYRIIDFQAVQSLLDRGIFVPAEAVRGKPASEFAPFVPFLYLPENATVFVNASAREVCEVHNERMSWPNPLVRCQAVKGDFSAHASLSAEAIDDLPRVFASIRDAHDRLLWCVEREY